MKKRDETTFFERCDEARRLAFSFKEPLIVHHYDCDGLSAAGVVCSAFIEANKKYRIRCIKKLDDETIDSLMNEKEIIFVDLGGGNVRVNELKDVIIIDHHQTEGIEKFQVNPMLFGIDGGEEISSSGVAYYIFKTRSDLAVVGGVGDMQSPFVGLNKKIAEEGVKSGDVKIENDVCFYGRYSRPLIQFLMYSDNPYIPGLSYREERVVALLNDIGINLKDNERWRRYCDLSDEEKRKLISALVLFLLEKNEVNKIAQLIRETYVLPKHEFGTETYEANEFSTLLNACGRHHKAEVGVGICLGDKNALEEGHALLDYHRTKLKEGVLFGAEHIQDLGKIYFLDARGVIDEAIIGTVCGMLLRPDMKKPLLGVAFGERETLKFSIRSTKALKLNMGAIMKEAALAVGGVGGGHRIAAGASIPKNKINEFLHSIAKYLD
jgi:RecJ-like exonuclease